MNTMKNKVQLIGNLGMNPDIRVTETGKKFARMNIATNESYKNAKGEKTVETTWHNLVAWGSAADIAEKYLQKGNEVIVEGKLVNRSYTDKTGVQRHITEVVVNEIMKMEKK